MLVFYEENQCVCLWGVRADDLAGGNDDPVVYQEFLRLAIYHHAAWGALDYGFEHPNAKEAIRAVEGTWEKVVDDRDLRIWKLRGVLLCHLGTDKGCTFAGQDFSALEALQKGLGLSGPVTGF